MASRAYKRDKRGRFAGSSGGGGGTFVTYGKAGGFANAGFRARVAATRSATRPTNPVGQKASPNKSLGKAAGARARVTRGRKAVSKKVNSVATFVKKNPQAVVYGGVLSYQAYSSARLLGSVAAQQVSIKAERNRRARAARATESVSSSLNIARMGRRSGSYKIRSFR